VAEPRHEGGYKGYVITWLWLLVITVLEISVVLVGLPKPLLATLLVMMSLMKAALIVAYFMHLRYERVAFIYTVIAPMIVLIVVLVAFVAPDAVHVLTSRR